MSDSWFQLRSTSDPDVRGIASEEDRSRLVAMIEGLRGQAEPILAEAFRLRQEYRERMDVATAIGHSAVALLVALGYSQVTAEKEVRRWQPSSE